MAGQLGHQHLLSRKQQRRQREPVRGRAAQSVDEHQRLALARDEVAQAAPSRLGEALLETRQFTEALLAMPTMRGRGGLAGASVFFCVHPGP